jgi:hypothetical protein
VAKALRHPVDPVDFGNPRGGHQQGAAESRSGEEFGSRHQHEITALQIIAQLGTSQPHLTGIDHDAHLPRPCGGDGLQACGTGPAPAQFGRVHHLEQNLLAPANRLGDGAVDGGIHFFVRAQLSRLVAKWNPQRFNLLAKASDGRSLLHQGPQRCAIAEMMAARGMGRAAAGLVRAGDDGDKRRAQQRLDQEKRLQLRIGARGREHHFSV